MALKITIEVDGQTEAQLAPVVGRLVAQSPDLLTGVEAAQVPQPPHVPEQLFYQENAAVLQQQIQQLIRQNQQLQLQLSGQQPRLAGVPEVRALPAARPATSEHPSVEPPEPKASAGPKPQRPKLPLRYQPGKGEVTAHRLYRSGQTTARRLWQLLVWLCFGREWLALFLLLCGGLSVGLVGGQTLMPTLTNKWRSQPEFVEKAADGPGDTVAPEQPAHEKTNGQTTNGQTTDSNPTNNPVPAPASPRSKAGSKPPPPPAFQY